MRRLPDVNVLVALAWPNHVHHAVAGEWFKRRSGAGWATCPVTESGFVRVSSNPAMPHAVSPAEAIEFLRRLRAVGDHVLLVDDVSVVDSEHVDQPRIASFRQVTDAHIVGIARRHGAVLTTLDGGIAAALSRTRRDATIELIRG